MVQQQNLVSWLRQKCYCSLCLGKVTILALILISERCVTDDVFTSVKVRLWLNTKLGAEEITRDIPNVSEESLKS